MPPSTPELVLHMDVNKTLVMADPAAGVSHDGMINSILSESCWGTVPPDVLKEAEAVPPEDRMRFASHWTYKEGPCENQPAPDTVTFADYVERVLKLPWKEYKALKTAFTDKGAPGEQVAGFYQRLQGALEGEMKIFPSFYNMVKILADEGRSFRIVFRTFGIDLPHIIKEWNAFCQGKHPDFPTFSSPDHMVREPDGTATFWRDEAGIHLAFCGWEGGVSSSLSHVTVAHGVHKCAAAINAKITTSPPYGLAIRDCYEWWDRSGRSCDSGKILPIDPSADSPHHIFFDDNIERDRMQIVDARCLDTGRTLTYQEVVGTYAVRVLPIEAALDRDYFINAVRRCEESRRKAKQPSPPP
eukprot:Sspe_Gene.18629::Locus_6718_Transcript_1_1_Confidence_1.000_Length_1158::g.18629::m.18629